MSTKRSKFMLLPQTWKKKKVSRSSNLGRGIEGRSPSWLGRPHYIRVRILFIFYCAGFSKAIWRTLLHRMRRPSKHLVVLVELASVETPVLRALVAGVRNIAFVWIFDFVPMRLKPSIKHSADALSWEAVDFCDFYRHQRSWAHLGRGSTPLVSLQGFKHTKQEKWLW